jgi:hypothetical protein
VAFSTADIESDVTYIKFDVLMKKLFLIGVFLMTAWMAYATGSVTLAWNASTDPIVVGYNVYYGGASGVYTNEVNAYSVTNITLSGLTPGVTYYFAATTYAASGLESPFSSEVSYLVPNPMPPPPAPPTNLHYGWWQPFYHKFTIITG